MTSKLQVTGDIIGKEDGLKFVEKIRIINGVKYIQKKKGQAIPPPPSPKCLVFRLVLPKVIVMGASTGGPQALEVIFSGLKDRFSIPIVCIQHISQGFLAGMLTWLRGICPLIIETAKEGGFPLPGHIYFPPEGMHLTFSSNGAFALSPPNPDDIYCPSIDKLFHSTAEVFGSSAVAVILSGMGRDGASGMKSIFDAGGDTVAQDEDSSIIFGMPAVAINLGVICNVLPVNEVAPYLNHLPRNISL